MSAAPSKSPDFMASTPLCFKSCKTLRSSGEQLLDGFDMGELAALLGASCSSAESISLLRTGALQVATPILIGRCVGLDNVPRHPAALHSVDAAVKAEQSELQP